MCLQFFRDFVKAAFCGLIKRSVRSEPEFFSVSPNPVYIDARLIQKKIDHRFIAFAGRPAKRLTVEGVDACTLA